jgi:hypothetical protein
MTPAVAFEVERRTGARARRADPMRGDGAGERRIDGDPGDRAWDAARVRGDGAGERRIDGDPGHRDRGADSSAVRRSARRLHAACAELLPGYAEASREPWRQALLTAGCLDGRPRLAPREPAPPLIVEDVVQPSDVLCALWLARRTGLFSPGSSCGDAVGLRSACDIVPAFVDGVSPRSRADVLAVLRANAAWRAHRAARRAA